LLFYALPFTSGHFPGKRVLTLPPAFDIMRSAVERIPPHRRRKGTRKMSENIKEPANKKSKKKRILITVLIVAGALFLLFAILLCGAWSVFGEFVKAASGIRELEDGVYYLDFEGDYGLEKFMEGGGASSDAELADFLIGLLSHGFYKIDKPELTENEFGCSTVTAKTADGVLFGRNYDWSACRSMIVHCKPDKGYESVSTCCIDFLGFGDEYDPAGGMQDRFMSLAAIYVPLDGMNSEGLMIADLMAGDKEATHQNTDKPDVTTTSAIRLILDRAATVDEAIELLKTVDMNSSIGSAHHFSIADKTGRSVCIEYIDGEMIVTETSVLTNFYLAEKKYGTGSEQSKIRFSRLTETLNENPPSTAGDIASMLSSVAQFNFEQDPDDPELTCWSIVFSPEAGTARYYFGERYDKYYDFSLVTGKLS